MTTFQRHPRLRWLFPLVAAVLLIGAGPAVALVSNATHGPLPHRTAAQLLTELHQPKLDALSGTVVQKSDLGLPDLPGLNTGSTSLTSLLSGTHTLRVWYDGPSRMRLSVLDQLGESDVIRNGTNLWTWSSAAKTATHHTLPATKPAKQAKTSMKMSGAGTPQQSADAVLKAIDPTTKVTPDGSTTVAGRSAYQLRVTPRTSQTLVGHVELAIDSATHVPLRVQVFARGLTTPAFEAAFTSFDPSRPSASMFEFNPPPGTKVTQNAPLSQLFPGEHGTTSKAAPHKSPKTSPKTKRSANARPRTVGTGWATVLVTHVPADAASGSASLGRAVGALPEVSGSWGSGHLLRGTLVSVLVTNDGRLVVGAVPPQVLYDALAAT